MTDRPTTISPSRGQDLLPPHLSSWKLPSGWTWGPGSAWTHPWRHVQEVIDPLERSLALVSTPDASWHAWLTAEARALAHHNQESIPTAYHFWGQSSHVIRGPAYLRRWIQGESLRRALSRGGPLPFREAMQLLRDVGRTLAYLHNRGRAHGAITLDALWVTPVGRTWVLGWEWCLDPEVIPAGVQPPRIEPGAPELCRTWTPTPASDQWDLGNMTIRALGGWDAVPQQLHAIFRRTQHEDPAERFPSVAAFLRELDRLLRPFEDQLDPRPQGQQVDDETIVRWITGDDYEVKGTLGRGGNGTVWKVQDLHLQRTVAFKVFDGRVSGDRKRLAAFQREAMAAASLHHPGILPVLDWDSRGGHHWYTMPLADGGSLAGRLARQGAIDWRTVHAGMTHVLGGLLAAHDAGILHRDVKPSNILLTRWGGWQLGDFGLASMTHGDNTPGGTLGYAAPEQLFGEEPTPAVDVFSVAATALEALTGRPPFPAANEGVYLTAILRGAPEGLWDLPQPVADLLARCLAYDPAARPSLSELASAWATVATAID
jgi:serine/threonine-protein kinase